MTPTERARRDTQRQRVRLALSRHPVIMRQLATVERVQVDRRGVVTVRLIDGA